MARSRRRPAKARSHARTASRQPMAAFAIAIALALTAFAAEKYMAAKREAPAAGAGPSDEEIYTGSILYIPDDGKVCRQLFFNNRSGRFTDNGYVNCEEAAYHYSCVLSALLNRWLTMIREIMDGWGIG